MTFRYQISLFLVASGFLLDSCQTLRLQTQTASTSQEPQMVYYLPQRALRVRVPFLITTTTERNENEGTASAKVVRVQVGIRDSISIQNVLLADQNHRYQLKPPGEWTEKLRGNYNVALETDVSGLHLLRSINAETSDATAESIGLALAIPAAAAQLASSFVGITAGVAQQNPGKKNDEPVKTIEVVTERTVWVEKFWLPTQQNEHITIDLSEINVFNKKVVAERTEKSANTKVILVLHPLSTSVDLKSLPAAPAIPAGVKKPAVQATDGIAYREATTVQLSVFVQENYGVSSALVADRALAFPQLTQGISFLPWPESKGKFTLAVEFNLTNGGLRKYSLKKETRAAAAAESINKGSKELSDQVTALGKSIQDYKKNDSRQAELDRLKIEKDILSTQNEIKKLQEAQANP